MPYRPAMNRPANAFFVRAGYPDVKPYYSTLQKAITDAPSGTTIYSWNAYDGQYTPKQGVTVQPLLPEGDIKELFVMLRTGSEVSGQVITTYNNQWGIGVSFEIVDPGIYNLSINTLSGELDGYYIPDQSFPIVIGGGIAGYALYRGQSVITENVFNITPFITVDIDYLPDESLMNLLTGYPVRLIAVRVNP